MEMKQTLNIKFSPRCEGCGILMPNLEHEEIVETRESNDGALLCMICED